jgi:hypothetical protein
MYHLPYTCTQTGLEEEFSGSYESVAISARTVKYHMVLKAVQRRLCKICDLKSRIGNLKRRLYTVYVLLTNPMECSY